ncbi:MAG: transketolase [Calditrichia bacterium]
MNKYDGNIDTLSVNTIRMLAADCVEKANSGHPGMPMGAAAMAYVLWTKYMKHNPKNPKWINRDRFILSAGHGSALLYSLLHLSGYDVSLEDLKQFRQWGSKTPGHPEYGHTPGVETTTGPLGQGFATGVGMAIAQKHLAARFNKPGLPVVDHYIYGIVSDGDLMEGISHEAASLAGHLKLGNIIYLYDDNHISIDGETELAFTEDRVARFRAYGWHVQVVDDGNDLKSIGLAIEEAQKISDRPSLIAVRTHIGYGSPNKVDTAGVHGSPLGAEEMKLTRQNLDWPEEPFFIPEEVKNHFNQHGLNRGIKDEEKWNDLFKKYAQSFPEDADRLMAWIQRTLPSDWEKYLPEFEKGSKAQATRSSSGEVINALAPIIENLVGGSADLAPSNKTTIKNSPAFQADSYQGRNIHFGVREHVMGAILNGMALYGGIIPFGGTFLVFADYMRPAIRLAAMMKCRVVYVFTHDSIGLGEDGPTHQPIEHLASLRVIPGLTVIRPADANETAQAWKYAIKEADGPVALALTRQNVPVLDKQPPVNKGAYIVKKENGNKPDLIIIGTGSELHIALDAAEKLESEGKQVRVVSMPSLEIFNRQSEAYQSQILPNDVIHRIVVEAGSTSCWAGIAGTHGKVIGLDHFGASAPYEILYEKFGITAERIVEEARNMLG